jgi:hypothetical protein
VVIAVTFYHKTLIGDFGIIEEQEDNGVSRMLLISMVDHHLNSRVIFVLLQGI